MSFSLAQHATKLKFLMNENSTTILTGVGVVGTVATAYFTGQATFKAAELIKGVEEDRKLHPEEYRNGNEIHVMTNKMKAQLVWKEYAPAVGVGLITITCIILAQRISSKRIAALTVASGISERALREYKEKVASKLGRIKETDIRDEIAQDRVNANPPNSREVIITGNGNVLCYDNMTGRYFESSIEEIKRAEIAVNHEIGQQLSVSLSRFFDEIGLSPTTYTDMVGWHMNNLLEVIFSTTMSPDGRPCIAIDFSRPPSPDYDKLWT